MERPKQESEEILILLAEVRNNNKNKRPVTCQECFNAISPKGETDLVVAANCRGFCSTRGKNRRVKRVMGTECVLASDIVINDGNEKKI